MMQVIVQEMPQTAVQAVQTMTEVSTVVMTQLSVVTTTVEIPLTDQELNAGLTRSWQRYSTQSRHLEL